MAGLHNQTELRFDVETLIIATTHHQMDRNQELRFDVETLIIATGRGTTLLE